MIPRLGFDESKNCRRLKCTGMAKDVEEIFRNGTGCKKRRQGGLIGKGMTGKAYQTKCGRSNEYVTKWIPFTQSYNREMFYLEILCQEIAAKAGLAPRILDSWVTKKAGVIVMEKVTGPTVDQINRMNVMNRKNMKKGAKLLARSIADTLTRLHKLGVTHGDSHVDNMIWDESDHRIKLIDFGRASLLDRVDRDRDVRNINRDYTYAVETFIEEPYDYERTLFEAISPYVKRDVNRYIKE